MPEISRFGLGKASHHSGATGAADATWFDVDMADDADRQWLMDLQEIEDQTRQALLAPVRFNHYEQVPDGTLVSIRTPRSEQIEDISELADLKLLIGPARAMTVRSGPIAAASITTLGFGDVLLKYPWRHIGPLIAISGVLMFGCSTAFLFVIMQDVWVGHL